MNRDRLVALLLLAFSLGYGWQAGAIQLLPFQADGVMTARTMPYALAGAGALISFLMLILPARPPRPTAPGETEDDQAPPPISVFWRGLDWKSAGWILLAVAVYGALIRPLGFIPSTFAFLCACSIVMGERRPLALVAVHAPAVLGFWLLMTKVLGQTL